MSAAHEIVETVARCSYGKLVAFLASRTRDVSVAEDALSDAFAIALTDWPRNGLPANPEAWLLTVARRQSINHLRHRQRGDIMAEELQRIIPDEPTHEIPDQRLALLFACAHPAMDPNIRAPLMLQTVLGLDAARIASAFLISPSAMSQRLVRAKIKIREAGIPFRIPEREDLPLVSIPFSKPSMAPSRKRGSMPNRLEIRVAISPPKPSSSLVFFAICYLGSRKRSAFSPYYCIRKLAVPRAAMPRVNTFR